ncbi:MAG: alkaline phosphatase D family protein [Gammaproteobacteria bacterium]|nr:alkaline phosphatase D family protein [Gammaproteobacteria bacterium]
MKIAFAASSNIDKARDQAAWKKIEREHPDMLLLLGNHVHGGSWSLSWKQFHKRLERQYRTLFAEKHFKHLIERVPFHATWDDHDFAKGDHARGAVVKPKQKERSRELFHRYMSCSTNLPEVYHTFDLGDARVILLDVRYYREAPSPTGSLLGQRQEAWLEQQLQHEHKYTLICAGSSLSSGSERWSRYRDYYDRFCAMAREKGHVLVLSGGLDKNRFVDHDGFFEVISSAVGRRKRDNYGIVDLQDNVVSIKLRGERKSDNDEILLDANSWQVMLR